jgi:hypothetical protein
MKLIDILNMISKGELKEGTKVIYNNDIYTYDEDELRRMNGICLCEDTYLSNLNDECELLEPDLFTDDGEMATYKIEELDKEEIMHLTLPSAIAVITDVLNKVINKVNVHSTVLLAQEKEIKEIKEQLDY